MSNTALNFKISNSSFFNINNQLILMYDQLTEAHKKLNQNVNPTLVFEQIVIKGVR